jgi:SAM-dependent methyltransferase
MSALKEHNREIVKYDQIYKSDPKYGMSWDRFNAAATLLKEHPELRASILDVGASRGEILRAAVALDFGVVKGTEVVRMLLGGPVVKGDIINLPFDDGEFETVCCFDVLEHLVTSSIPKAISELSRVASRRILISVSNIDSVYPVVGELHVTKWEYDEWARVISNYCMGWSLLERSDVSSRVSHFIELLK